MSERLVIFTDLDGTLLDARTYSSAPADDTLRQVRELGVPVVFCTSKTRAETLYWRERLSNDHPFVFENGGGVCIPERYFSRTPPGASASGGYLLARFGTPYKKLREAVASLRESGFDVRGFGDMTPDEVAGLTGLPRDQAVLAGKREYDEPFVYLGDKGSMPLLLEAIGRIGLRHTSGRLMHILGDNDKGRAVSFLTGLYAGEFGGVVTAGLGDSPNDGPMLDAVDYPFLVRKPEGGHDPDVAGGRVARAEGAGPEGWAEAVTGLLRRLGLV